MAESTATISADPLAGRVCGTCTACCISLAIDDPALRKPAGQPCLHRIEGRGCAIYPSRPGVCRDWLCGWRALDWVGDGLRPDDSGVLIFTPRTPPAEAQGFARALILTILAERGLDAPALPDAVAGAIGRGIAVLLYVPGRPGAGGAQMLVNHLLAPAVAAGNMALLRRDLAELYHPLRFLAGTGRLAG